MPSYVFTCFRCFLVLGEAALAADLITQHPPNRRKLRRLPPKGHNQNIFDFFGDAGPRADVQGILLALRFIFPGRIHFLDAYLPSYCTFRHFGRALEAVIKSAASAASRKTKSRGPRSREAPGRRFGKRTAASRGAPWIFVPWTRSSWMIMASISFHVPMSAHPILDPAV